MTLNVKQESRYQGNDWWRWSVWLEGTTDEMAAINHVVYTLHATFPNPVRMITDRRNGFRLDSSGWGEFELYLGVHLKNKKLRKLKHWLTLPHTEMQGGSGSGGEAAISTAPVEGPRTAFVSSGADNAQLERRIRDVLSERGFRVVNRDDVAAGVPIETGVNHLMDGAEAAIFLLSGRPNLTIKMEIARAKANGVPHLVPVLVGSTAELPSELQGVQTVMIDDKMNPELLADQIFGAGKI